MWAMSCCTAYLSLCDCVHEFVNSQIVYLNGQQSQNKSILETCECESKTLNEHANTSTS